MKIYQGIVLGVFTVSTLMLAGCNWLVSEDDVREIALNTSTGEHTFTVEIADDKDSRTLGLMHRDSLDDEKGMLFIYEEERTPAFWMKNMQIPIDIIFMDKDFTVVDYFENVPPCEEEPCERYMPASKSQYILEVTAGTSSKIVLEKGDKAEMSE